MTDKDEGLKDRRDLLQELKSLFLYEDQLLDGWCSLSEFEESVMEVVKDLSELIHPNE